VRCALIDAEKANYPIMFMCRLLSVPRSTFYAWRTRALSATAARRQELAGHVRRVFAAARGTYGCRRVAAALNRAGIACSVGLVADLMREHGLKACQPRAYKRTTVPGPTPAHRPDLIGRDFTAAEPGTRLVGDITHLRTGQGWLYLATVIDLATRMVVGWQTAEHLRTSLVIDALAMVHQHGHLRPGAIFHADRGCQYTSAELGRFCARIRVRPSVGRTGMCWDNAAAESFFAALKNEMYHRETFPTRARARFAVAEYIEIFYNRQRLHSTLGYRTPAEALTHHQHRTAPHRSLTTQPTRTCPRSLTHLRLYRACAWSTLVPARRTSDAGDGRAAADGRSPRRTGPCPYRGGQPDPPGAARAHPRRRDEVPHPRAG